ncbi:MAG: hypothetical protein OZSIB_1363 [Candidatus Ozemobacter sibiricus]|jgi:hypothetical protein|uniref:DUF1257 domain-containing protein n=1 Tax=Candidatus Ozemobacter sibiricus TaxID=2268124 RepID=A0A367ZJY3_9BACT|nr:MAG: hypothetical protein OZSIB_1363 [Candidatus Ozemobacter sibiricus]
MSAFVVLVPAVMGGPAFAAAVAVAGAAMGLKLIQGASAVEESWQQEAEATSVEVDLPKNYALAETVDEGESTVLEGNGFRVTFAKTGRGDVQMRVEGQGKSERELEKLGRDLLNRVAQQYAYQKLTKELKKRGFNLVQEQVEADQTIRLTVRR